jgi:hypothetical protein
MEGILQRIVIAVSGCALGALIGFCVFTIGKWAWVVSSTASLGEQAGIAAFVLAGIAFVTALVVGDIR